MTTLAQKHCVPMEGRKPLSDHQIEPLRQQLHERWHVVSNGKKLEARFEFSDYLPTLTFVNAAAHVAVRENHHPDISFGYNVAQVAYSTHDVDGLSENDFICAAKLDGLVA